MKCDNRWEMIEHTFSTELAKVYFQIRHNFDRGFILIRHYDLDSNPEDLDPNVDSADLVIEREEYMEYPKFLIPYLENKEFKIEKVHRYAGRQHICMDFSISWMY